MSFRKANWILKKLCSRIRMGRFDIGVIDFRIGVLYVLYFRG